MVIHKQMTRKTICLVLVLALILAVMPLQSAAAANDNVSEAKSDIENRYSILLDISTISIRSVEGQLSAMEKISSALELIPPEVHNALVSYFKACGRKITVKLDDYKGENFMLDPAAYYYPNTITIRIITYGDNCLIQNSAFVFCHEYGHMLHQMLNAKYGSSNIQRQWLPLNYGTEYSRTYSSTVLADVFWRGYGGTSMNEDIADTFAVFSSLQAELRDGYEDYKSKPFWQKGMLLQDISKTALGVDRLYYFLYIPQTPSSWARDAVERGFCLEDGILTRNGMLRQTNIYQEPITRIDMCKHLISMIEQATATRHNIKGGIPYYAIFDPKTGVEVGFRSDLDESCAFTDVPKYDSSFGFAAQSDYWGLMKGVSENLFDPDGLLTREQAATIIQRTGELLGLEDAEVSAAPTDLSAVSSWAKNGVEYAMRNGIMTGTGNGAFSPKDTYSYEQAYVTLVRMYDLATAS